ncbi:MAG TPA: energy transducer TonB, partial [Burkholderiaceae bacterium]|nr:energy transducer TonB [Burkholderiaceae bacterium]
KAAGFMVCAAVTALLIAHSAAHAQQASPPPAPASQGAGQTAPQGADTSAAQHMDPSATQPAAGADASPVDCSAFKREERWRASRTEQRADGSEFVTPQMRVASPIYPASELRKGLSGTVLMEFTIEANGQPTDLVVQQTPGPAFSRYARASVLCSQYRPATVNGTPVAMRVRLPFRYEISP